MTEPAIPSTAPAWTVTGQRQQDIIDASGNVLAVWTVTYMLANGTTGSVNVPANAYSPANVAAAINAQAATVHAVNNLSSEG